MLLKIHPITPQKNAVTQIVSELRSEHVIILPTDTVYALTCLLSAPKAINELYRLKGMDEDQPLSLLCRDIAMASHYAVGIPNHVFRFMKARTPGPYTFIFKANRNVDRRGTGKKNTVGIRIVDHPLHRMLMEQLDIPIVSTSITSDDEFYTDPDDLDRIYGKRLSMVVDGGIRPHQYSTVVDCTDGVKIVREGLGDTEGLEEE